MASRKDLQKQFENAKLRGWIPYFEAAAAKHGFSTADLMAIASRESNMKNIKGDFHDGQYHGFSLMQLDIRSHREWILSGKWQDVGTAIEKGAMALAEKRAQIIRTSGMKAALVRFSSGKTAQFIPKPLTQQSLRHCTLAAYNCGIASYYHYSIGNDIDRGTTGKDYGRDVIARSAVFQSLLNSDKQPAPVAPPAVRAAESVAEQESADSQAENSVNSLCQEQAGTDLLGAAVSSEKAKAATLKLWPRIVKHSGAGLTFLWAIIEANKVASILVLLVIVAGVAWLLYHNRQKLAPHILKLLK